MPGPRPGFFDAPGGELDVVAVPRASSMSCWSFGSLKTSHQGRSASEAAGAGGPCTSR